MIVWW